MNKSNNKIYDAIYSSREDESKMFESPKDIILSEALGFYQYDSEVDDDIVDKDDDGEVESILENDPNYSQFLGLGKKNKQKRKDRRAARRKKIKAFFDRQKQNIKNLIKDPIKAIKKGIQEVGKGIKQAALAVPRGAALTLIALNVKGLATKITYLTPDAKVKLGDKWTKLGGKKDQLWKAAAGGRSKHALICGSSCRSNLPKLAKDKSNFDGYNLLGPDYLNSAGGVDIAALMVTGSAVLGAIAGIIKAGVDVKKGGVELKAMEAQVKQQEDAFKAEESRKSASQKKEEALAEAALLAQMSPEQQILASAVLSPEEKAAAIADLDDSIGSKVPWKPILIGVGIVGVIGLAWYIVKKVKKK